MGGGGSKPKPAQEPAHVPISDTDKARLDIKRQRDRLSKGEQRCRVESNALQEHAKNAVASGDRESAVRFLKLSKLKQKRREDVFKMINNLEGMLNQMESLQDMQAVSRALEVGTAALQAMEKDLSVEQAERIMEDAADALQYAAEIDAVFSRELSTGVPGTTVSDDLEAEVGALFAPARTAPAPAAPQPALPADLPQLPTHAPARQQAAKVAIAS